MKERFAARLRQPGTRRLLGLAVALGAAFGYWSPAFLDLRATGFGDWQYFHHMWEVGWVAMARFHEIALWNPYQCGGVPLWGDPQAQTYGPWFLLALAFGATVALKIGVVLHTTVGLVGAYRYARDDHRLTRPAATLAAVTFCGSGFFAWHIAGGHAAFLPFYFAPLLAWTMRRAFDDVRYTVGVAGLVALTVHEGGVYPIPYFALLLLLETLGDRRASELPRAVGRLALAGLLSVLLGALRFVAIAIEVGRHPRPTLVDDRLGLDELAMMLTAREHDWGVPGHPYVWPEYCAYVGIAIVVLGIVGYHVAARSGRVRLVVGTLGFGLLAMGNLGAYAPWVVLHDLPVFASLRVPSRFVVLFIMFLGLVAAVTLDAFARRFAQHRRTMAALQWLIVAGIAADLTATTRPIVNRWNGGPIAPLERDAVFEQRPPIAHATAFASLPRLGVGSTGCYVVLDYRVAPGLRVGPGPQVEVVRGVGVVELTDRTTNTLAFDVRAQTPVSVVVNQNFAPDFVTDVGRLEDHDGRLSVALPAGHHRVHVRYAPRSLRLALAPFAVGVVLATFVGRRTRRQRPAADPPPRDDEPSPGSVGGGSDRAG